jgi:hypothetical protein
MKFLLSLKLSTTKVVIPLKLGKIFEADFFENLLKKLIGISQSNFGIEPKTHKTYAYTFFYLQTKSRFADKRAFVTKY